MPFLHSALFLLRKTPEHLTQVLPQLNVKRFPPALRDEHHMTYIPISCDSFTAGGSLTKSDGGSFNVL